jgi:hypothetical protein
VTGDAASSTNGRRVQAPWWATLVVTMALLALASRMIVGQEQLAIAGAIVGVVGAHWLPATNTTRRDNGGPQ